MRYEDDYDQDNDTVGAARSMVNPAPQSPTAWLGAAMPPWQMWGNSQVLTVPTVTATAQALSNQLLRISYGRPETWHWLFSARLLENPAGAAPTIVQVIFDVIVGIGRSAQRLDAFETLSWTWFAPNPPPTDVLLRTTDAIGTRAVVHPAVGVRTFERTVINELTAQDIQVACRIVALIGGAPVPGSSAVVEVSAHFAPKNHIRPDWYREAAPLAVKFAGGEVEGR